VVLLLLVLPNTFGTGSNVMTVLLGLETFLYDYMTINWISKLLRIGNRIVFKNENTSFLEDDQVFRMLLHLARANNGVILLVMCLLPLILPLEPVFLLVGGRFLFLVIALL
jgi:hypothetical protein